MKWLKLIITGLLLTGCAAGSSIQKEEAGGAFGGQVISKSDNEEIRSGERVIIYNAEITVETDDTAALSARVAALAVKFGGYVVSAADDRVVIRVEAAKFESAVEEIKKLDDDAEVRVFTVDVTEEYRDTQIRLDNKLKARERYLELLKRAENVQAALQVERELERLNVEIEELKGRMARLTHLARYSTITVVIDEEVKPGPLGYVFYGVYRVVKWLFIRN